MERARRAYNDKSLQTDMMLERKLAILSPSDFGFHNALRQKDNRLVFVDFEYFGWDDPVKMLSDFLLHPGMTLTSSLRGMFCARFCSLFEDDRQLGLRFRSLYPLYALRWTMILLNEFLPERLERRILSGSIRHVGAAQRKQLLKANSMIAHCRDALHHFPYAVTPDSIQ